jgi:hypothetical protein
MKDNRDPDALGEKLLAFANHPGRQGMALSEIYDRASLPHNRALDVPNHTADPSPVEKYGDPVASHRARIAAGLEVELP